MKTHATLLLMDEKSCNPPVNGTKQLISEGPVQTMYKGKKLKEGREVIARVSACAKMDSGG
jgi:hypothetical protein